MRACILHGNSILFSPNISFTSDHSPHYWVETQELGIEVASAVNPRHLNARVELEDSRVAISCNGCSAQPQMAQPHMYTAKLPSSGFLYHQNILYCIRELSTMVVPFGVGVGDFIAVGKLIWQISVELGKVRDDVWLSLGRVINANGIPLSRTVKRHQSIKDFS